MEYFFLFFSFLFFRPKDTSTRSISTTNSAFISRISSVRGGVDFLLALGFEEQATTKRIGMSNSGGGVVITSGTQVRRRHYNHY